MKNYRKNHKKSLLWLIIALVVIFVSSMTGSLIQSRGGKIAVYDLRNATNSGEITLKATYNETNESGESETKVVDYVETVKGKVVSGILFVPKEASKENKLPGVVLTHGYLNNRELQLPFAIELARRGFVVLTVDREGHGNYESTGKISAMMATAGLYDSAKYLYNLDYVDQSKIGITGHSMGGYTTAVTLAEDAKPLEVTVNKTQKATVLTGRNIIKAGLIQGWSTFIGAAPNVSVGLLKANDDEFFFNSKDCNGNPTISRQFLQSQGAADFVKVKHGAGVPIDIKNGAKYVNGSIEEVELGKTTSAPFRVIYEADEIHPLNHWSIPSTANLIDFFYTSFGTPTNRAVIATSNQVWWVKEIFAFIGMLALLSLIFPAVSLLLTAPYFGSLKVRTNKKVNEDGTIAYEQLEMTPDFLDARTGSLKHWYDYIIYFVPAIVCTIFSGFTIKWFTTELGDRWFPNTQLFPQDTTNWVALWSMVCGLFALAIVLLGWLTKYIIAKVQDKKGIEHDPVESPLQVAHISSFHNVFKTLLLALIVVVGMFAIVFINWGIWKVDFRIWTLAFKVFNVPEMLPTAVRYFIFFFIFYLCAGIANQTYRTKTLPEWASTAINAFFNVFGIILVIGIQYGTFKSSGYLWQDSMALGYIVVFPIIPILIFATIISRELYKKTGNVYLGSLINALLWTMVTISGTAASFPYVLG